MATELERGLGRGDGLLMSATARAAALERAHERCSAVIAPSRVWIRPDAVVAVAVPVAPGASLAEVRAGRALSVGECLTVGVAVADALAALHAERLAHGDISAANVMVSGRKVALVDTMGALGEERGTPGFAAPERAAGASPAGDVFALGMLLRFLADAQALPVIVAWTAPLVAADPESRPSAAHAAAALARCAPTAPVRAPESPVAAAMRAGAVERTTATRRDRGWRAQKLSLRLAPLALLAVFAAISGPSLLPAMAGGTNPRAQSAVEVEAAGAPAAPDMAARELVRARIAALAAGDGAALLAVSAPGSPSAQSDAATAKALTSGTLAFEGLVMMRAAATTVESTPSSAVVEVTTTLSDYRVGQEDVLGGTATAKLELVLTPRGWLVERVLPQS